MQVAIASDLHFEFHQSTPSWLPPLPKQCDILILAGDIDIGNSVLEAINRILQALPNTKIIWVAGNHEFYKQSIDTQIKHYRDSCECNQRLYYLENESVTLDGYRFLGCTLWSGFNSLGIEKQNLAMREAQRLIPDFSLIRNHHGDSCFLPADALAKFEESYDWLNSELPRHDASKTVVVTHFPPIREARHTGIAEDILSAYFQADCKALILQHQPALWVYGHNHFSANVTIGNTIISSNQLGYPGEEGIPQFNEEKLFSI